MENNSFISFPPQILSYKSKGKKWRKQHLDWADGRTFTTYSPVRNSVIHKKINYDLYRGKLHMSDLALIFNPYGMKASYIPKLIQHYPVMNTKLEVLYGEELSRVFDYKVIVTNPTAITEKEQQKKQELLQMLQQIIQDTSTSEDEFNQKMQEMSDYFSYEWQDFREIRANALIHHYERELDFKSMFNDGFKDATIVAEELYQCYISGGEPRVRRLNPLNVLVYKNGYSNKVEDADVIIIEDYWSRGQVLDVFHDELTKKDIEYIESLPFTDDDRDISNMGEVDERKGFINSTMVDDAVATSGFYFNAEGLFGDSAAYETSLMPYDIFGNVRVIQMFWKSVRKIKKVKFYDQETGEARYDFFPETYQIDEARGEEEEILYINEAWEGTKIGEKVYVRMRPMLVQHNRLSNPSECNFGIYGTIYNINEGKPYSLVDRMKPYNYLYDVIHDRLNTLIAKNWGKLATLDLAKVPAGWDVDKWMYYAKTNSLNVVDSFKEANRGPAGKIMAGALSPQNGVIDAELGNSIQAHITILEFIKTELGDIIGVNRQREGQIANRETVGGVERATLQSSHITEWIFAQHDYLKKRVYEGFLEYAKICLRGRKEKFQYILPNVPEKLIEIDGDEFAECDYGLVVDNSSQTQQLAQKLDMLAQAGIQNGISFATIMKLYSSISVAEKVRIIENDENRRREEAQQQQQQKLQIQQQQIESNQQIAQMKMQQEDQFNIRDNQTKIEVAQINAMGRIGSYTNDIDEMTPEKKQEFMDQVRQWESKIGLEQDKLQLEKEKMQLDERMQDKEIASKEKIEKMKAETARKKQVQTKSK